MNPGDVIKLTRKLVITPVDPDVSKTSTGLLISVNGEVIDNRGFNSAIYNVLINGKVKTFFESMWRAEVVSEKG